MPPKGFTKKKVLQSPSSLKEVHAALKRPRSPPRASDVPPQQPPPPPPPSLPLEAEASPRKKRGRPRRPHRELQGTRESTPLASAPATDATATAVTAVTATAVTATAVTATARTPAGPPPLLGCLAACFGWRLASYAASEDGTARFGLRHVADASVAVSVVVPPQAFEVSTETSESAVLLNGIAVPLAECPAHLQQLRENGGQRRLSSLPQASAAALPATPPAVQPTPEEGGAKTVPVGLRPPSKRQRSSSLSPPPLLTAAEEPQPPPSPPPSCPLNLVSTSGDTTREDRATEEAAQEEQLDASPDEQPNVEEPPPLVISREEEDEEEDTVSVLVLKAEERSTPSPSSSSVESPSADGGAPVKEEFFFALIAEGAAGPPPPPPVALPLDVQPRNSVTEATNTATAIADTTAAAASEQMGAETVMVAVAAAATADDKSASPPARLPSSVASLVRRALLGSRSPHPRRTDIGGVLSESAIKKEQQLVGTASAAPAFDATVASAAAPPVAHSPSTPVLPLLPPQGAVRRSFVMPYMTLSSSASCGTTTASPKGAGAASNDGSGGFAMNAFIGADGCTATSSRSWLAHTHAVSRTFGLARAASEEKEAKAEANTTAAAVAAVRATLRQRWLQRSSLWSHMEESLRLSVGSGRLRGDALEAGVLALQAGEKELLLYDGARERSADSPPLRPFPTPVPRPLLPVSGTMVVEAQHRIAAAEEAEASAHYHHNTRGSSRKRNTLAPRYTVYPDGIPAADRLVIDRTYTTRGSYVVATAAAPFSFGGKRGKAESTSKAKGNSGMASLPMLCENLESDLYSYVFKRYPAPNASEPPLAVAVPDGTDTVSSAVAPAAKEENSEEDGHVTDKREETRADSGPPPVGLTSPSPTATTTATHLTADVAEAVSAMDLDYVLRYRPNIRRIPMPDVESRYGL